MATTTKRSFGTILLQIALGLMFIVGGIWTLQNGRRGDELAAAIRSIFDGKIENILCIVMAIIEIVLGVFLLLRLFVYLGTSLDSILMLIVMIVWIAFMVLVDILGSSGLLEVFKHGKNFLDFLYRFASHLIVLGAIIKVRG